MSLSKTLEILKTYSIYDLGGYDGCLCTSFSINKFKVSVSCHKSEQCVRVVSDFPGESEILMREVIKHIEKVDGRPLDGYRIRFCAYRMDHHQGHWKDDQWCESYLCCYCEKIRSGRDGYLCEKCSRETNARASYPWIKDGFLAG